ncbi:hypothetical protein C8J57DRAFT_1619038 [Mycena rebaudengoi]|nr:hypothetical protein C8J57DRAFT_1619038 [Mycena rebaudengoi]
MPSEPPPSRPTTPHNDLLELTQQLTPSKTPRRTRQILQDIQSRANEAAESHGAVKRKLADVTNQLGDARPSRKRRLRHNRAAQAADDVENPATLEDRVRAAGRHFVIEYGLFLFTGIHTLLETEEDPSFEEDSEFDSEASRIQGQLRDVLALLPEDARAIRKQEWIDGMDGQRSTINTRLRHESLVHILAGFQFHDGDKIDINNFESSPSRFNAFAKRIGYQEATQDADAFYSPLKAEILFDKYDGSMDANKIFRCPILMKIYVSVIRGPNGAKGLFEGKSRLPAAKVVERIHHIERTTPGAIALCAVLAIWLFSADTQLVSEGDETKIDYKFFFVTFLRQICNGLRDEADWAVELFRLWDAVLFPNTEHSHGQTTSANRQAVSADVDAMDAAFEAASQRREDSSGPDQSQASTSGQHIGSPQPESSSHPTPSSTQQPESAPRSTPSSTQQPESSPRPTPSNNHQASSPSAQGREDRPRRSRRSRR